MKPHRDTRRRAAPELPRSREGDEQNQTIWRKGKQVSNPNLLLHDHGWSACGKRAYFLKRARLIVARSQNDNPETLGQMEEKLASAILARRLQFSGKSNQENAVGKDN
jgi:hypothetical protein